MPRLIQSFIRGVDAINYRVGRFIMYGIFAMMAILLWSSISKAISGDPFNLLDAPSRWTLEMGQFALVTYYVLGGPYAIQMGSNVRMDLFYGEWTARRKAWFDAFTVFFLIFYLGVLLYGGIGSTAYSLGYWGDAPLGYFAGLLTGAEEVGRLERSPTAWRPFLWPIKAIMILGIFLMLLQAISELLKDIALLRGVDLREDPA